MQAAEDPQCKHSLAPTFIGLPPSLINLVANRELCIDCPAHLAHDSLWPIMTSHALIDMANGISVSVFAFDSREHYAIYPDKTKQNTGYIIPRPGERYGIQTTLHETFDFMKHPNVNIDYMIDGDAHIFAHTADKPKKREAVIDVADDYSVETDGVWEDAGFAFGSSEMGEISRSTHRASADPTQWMIAPRSLSKMSSVIVRAAVRFVLCFGVGRQRLWHPSTRAAHRTTRIWRRRRQRE